MILNLLKTIVLFFVKIIKTVMSSPIFWIIAAIIAAAVALVLIYRKLKLWALSQIEYSRYFSTDGIFSGESCTMTEILRNPTLFPLFFVEMEFFVPSGLTVDGVKCSEYTKSSSIFHIPPYSTVQKDHKVTSGRRDHYKLHNASVEYRKNEFVFPTPIDIYVYPDKFFWGVDLSEEVKLAGEAIANKKYVEDPFFFSGLRRYAQGDTMRQVNFKASARSFSAGQRQLLCNVYESSRAYDTMIYLDLTDYSAADAFEECQNILENGLRCACHLFCQAEMNGGRVGFASNCSTDEGQFVNIPCETGNMHAKRILECFSQISVYARNNYSIHSLLKDAVKLPEETDIYFITSHVTDKNAELIRAMRRRGRSVSVIRLEGRDEA